MHLVVTPLVYLEVIYQVKETYLSWVHAVGGTSLDQHLKYLGGTQPKCPFLIRKKGSNTNFGSIFMLLVNLGMSTMSIEEKSTITNLLLLGLRIENFPSESWQFPWRSTESDRKMMDGTPLHLLIKQH
jgi:hypothetical protein